MVNWYRVLNALKPVCPEGTNTIKEALQFLYVDQNQSLNDIVDLSNRELLCLGPLRRKLADLGIPIKHKGGDNCSKYIPLTKEDFEQNSARELAKEHNVHITTIYNRKSKIFNS